MKKIILGIVIGIILSGGVVFAVTQLNAVDITYTKNGVDTTLDKALDNLYELATKETLFDVLPDTFYKLYTINDLSNGQGAVKENNSIRLPGGLNSVQYGPYQNIPSGCYLVLYNGTNLDNPDLEFKFHYNNGSFIGKRINNVVVNDKHAYYFLNLTEATNSAEYVIYNRSTTETTVVKSIVLYSNGICNVE